MKTPPDGHKQPRKSQCRQRNACLHQLPKPSYRDQAFITAQKKAQEKPPLQKPSFWLIKIHFRQLTRQRRQKPNQRENPSSQNDQ